MIKNKMSALDKNSTNRLDAINSIRYTLLLDYPSVPISSDTPNFIEELFLQCNKCCRGLFSEGDNPVYFNFFGSQKSESSTPLKHFYHYISPYDNDPNYKPGIPDLILQHCLFSSYHAILTELLGQTSVTSYQIVNKIKKDGIYALYLNGSLQISEQGVVFKSKRPTQTAASSRATNFTEKVKTHKSYLYELFSLLVDSKSQDRYKYFLQFSNLSSVLFRINPSTFDFTASKDEQAISFLMKAAKELEPPIKLNHLSESIFSNYGGQPIDGLYFYYLMERISNVRLLYSLLQQIYETETTYQFHLSSESTLDILSTCSKLPNVFSRQYFVRYAFEAFKNVPESYIDFWFQQSLERNSYLGVSTRSIQPGFQFLKWLEQYPLFMNYLSEYIIPIYEWCFLNMLLESIEKTVPGESHNVHLKIAFEKIASYVNKNYESILHPILLDIEMETVDVVTEIKNWHTLENLPFKVCSHLIKKIFLSGNSTAALPDKKDLNLNLPLINPDYFKCPDRHEYNNNPKRIRKFYLDLIKNSYINF